MTTDDNDRGRAEFDPAADPEPAADGAAPAPAVAPDSEPAVEPEPAPEPSIPGAVEIVSQGLDLNLGASSSIRRATLYAAAMFLILLGPVALVAALIVARYGTDIFFIDFANPVRIDLGPAMGVFVVGGFAVTAISIDLQNVAVGLMDVQASGRRLDLRPALAIARRSFWKLLFASFVAGIISAIVSAIIQGVLGFRRSPGDDVDFARQTILGLVVGMPFAYIGSAVVIGRLGPIAAIRASVRLARRRWRLAFVIGVVNTATGLLAAFALGAGGDILGRFATMLGIGGESPAGPLQIGGLALIIAVAIAAIGSLTMTVAALSVAPQVVAYRRLGGPRYLGQELDHVTPPPGEWTPPEIANRATPLITIGMWVAIALLALFTLAAIFRFA